MADTDNYNDSGLTEKLMGDIDKNSDDAASNQKPQYAASNQKPQSSDSSEKPKGLLSSKGKGGLVGAIKKDFSKPAAAPPTPTPDSDNAPLGNSDAAAPKGSSSIMGGNTAISTNSMKGSALANDPSSNLARKSEYRNVFHKRKQEGKHNW